MSRITLRIESTDHVVQGTVHVYGADRDDALRIAGLWAAHRPGFHVLSVEG